MTLLDNILLNLKEIDKKKKNLTDRPCPAHLKKICWF